MAGRGGGQGTAARRRWPLVIGGVAVVLVAVLALALGWPPTAPGPFPAPDAPAGAGLRMDAGSGHTCAVGTDGTLACWGGNTSGELGLGVRSPGRTTPVRVARLSADVASVSVAGSRSCAVTTAGAVWCWGVGFLGDRTTTDSTLPVAVEGLGSGVRSLSTGMMHTCVVTAEGGVLCWGENTSSELGQAAPTYDDNGSVVSGVTSSAVPVPVAGLESGVASVSAGWSHTCAVTTGGGLLCWGNNGSGQLGQPVPTFDDDGAVVTGVATTAAPTPVPGLESGIASVAAGGNHTCALTTGGAVLCWGDNGSGQLGQTVSTYDDHGTPLSGVATNAVPTPVPGLDVGVASLSAGWSQTCAVTTQGGVLCLGDNHSGQLGQAVPTFAEADGALVSGLAWSATPLPVPGLGSGVATVDVGAGHTCAVTTQGEVLCWGDNYGGQLGDATVPPTGTPRPVDLRQLPSASPTPREALLNLIVVEATLDANGDDLPESRRSTAATAARLYAREPAVLDAVRTGVREATSGRLDPRVEVVVAGGLLTSYKGCVPTWGSDAIERVAEPVRRAGAMNVILLRAPLCPDDQWGSIGGFDSWYGSPVVGWTSLSSVTDLVHVIVHEYGHDVSLWHAGLSTCTDAATLAGCQTDEVGDRASVMSYVHSSDTFTAPELARMGLLTEAEIVDVAAPSGEYHLVDLWEEGTKVVRLRGVVTDSGTTTVDFSRGLLQVEVRFDKEQGASIYGPEKGQPALSVVETEKPPAPGDVLLRQKHVTVTYEGPDADGNSVIKVTRTP